MSDFVEIEDNSVEVMPEEKERSELDFSDSDEIEVTFDEADEQPDETNDVTYEENPSSEKEEVNQPDDNTQEENTEEEGDTSEVDKLREELNALKEEKERSQFFEKFGSEDEYNSMIEWAGQNMPEDMIEGYNELITKESLSVDMQLALAGLLRSHMQLNTASKEESVEEGRMLTGKAAPQRFDNAPLVTVEDIEEAIANPLYGDQSPEGIAYTRKVNARTGIGMSSR